MTNLNWKPHAGRPAMTRDEKTLVTDLEYVPRHTYFPFFSKALDCSWRENGRLLLSDRNRNGDLVKPTAAILAAHGIDAEGRPLPPASNTKADLQRIVWENNRYGHRTHFSDSTRFDEICELCGATDADGDNRLNKTCRSMLISSPIVETSLTTDELDVINKLVVAWNAFAALPVEHPDDVTEFRHSLHALQLLILARPTRRALFDTPDETNTKEQSK